MAIYLILQWIIYACMYLKNGTLIDGSEALNSDKYLLLLQLTYIHPYTDPIYTNITCIYAHIFTCQLSRCYFDDKGHNNIVIIMNHQYYEFLHEIVQT